jgi:hypothetical protein
VHQLFALQTALVAHLGPPLKHKRTDRSFSEHIAVLFCGGKFALYVIVIKCCLGNRVTSIYLLSKMDLREVEFHSQAFIFTQRSKC